MAIFLHAYCAKAYVNMQPRLNIGMSRDDLDTLGKRVKARRQALGLSQVQLAAQAGMNQSDLSKIERGDISQSTKIAQLARALQCDAYWLATGDPLFHGEVPPEAQPVPQNKFHYVPVVGQGAGGTMPERVWTDGDFPVGVTNEYAEVVSPDPHAFIIQVKGPSMIPKYNPRDYALIEPSTDPDIEDDVLVRLADGQTLLKRLLSRRGHVRLGSYNDPEILVFDKEEVTWMYYAAYPVPARKIKARV